MIELISSTNQDFRIRYESFAKFSRELTNCRTFNDILACLKLNLKYLFNFHYFRLSYHWHPVFVHLEITPVKSNIRTGEQATYLPFESHVLTTGIPQRWTGNTALSLISLPNLTLANEPELWAWNFKLGQDRNMLVSLMSCREKKFNQKDTVFLKLVTEITEAKLLELILFQQLENKNNELEAAFHTIELKNKVINDIIDQQKDIISERTSEIADKNKRLLEISVLNAHQVREPLSRIMGLVSLLQYYTSYQELQTELFPKLKESATDLDEALRLVIEKATSDLMNLKA